MINALKWLALAAVLAGGGMAKETKAPNLELKLNLEKRVLNVNEYPKFDVSIINKSKQTVTLVVPGDGSESGMRTPLINWTIEKENAKGQWEAVKQESFGRCGNINALKPDEVFDLAPGKSRNISNWIPFRALSQPGHYKLTFHYTNQPSKEWQGIPLGSHDADAMARVKKSQECSLKSNSVIVTVTEQNNAPS